MKKYLLLIVIFLSCKAAPPAPTRPSIQDEWLGIYLAGTKIGYSYQTLKSFPDHYRLENRTSMRLGVMGTVQELTSTLVANTNLDQTFKDFDFELITRDHQFRALGHRENSKLLIEIRTGGSVENKVLDTKGKLYISGMLGPVLVNQGLKPNKTYKFQQFDPTLLAIVETEVTVARQESLKIGDSTFFAYKIESSLFNMTSTTWLDQNGRTLKEESPPGMTMVQESPDKALATESAISTMDILSLLSIKLDTVIANPRDCRYLKIQISNVDTRELDLATETQKILSDNPLILEIVSPDIAKLPKVFLPVSNQQEFLKPSPYIQSDNPEIIGQARIIIGATRDGEEAAKKILDWVYNNLQKRPTASVPSAIDVLRTKEGDCNEHSILFAAFCRAVGLPCKICVGVLGMGDGFYYHAWNKIYLGRWIPVDATFGQFPADAVHIEFKEGELEQQAKVLSVVGKIKIKVLEYR
jgi:transglutaminase-like putative cysteine protease